MNKSFLKSKLPVLLITAFGKSFTLLPYKVQMRLAVRIGRMVSPLLKRRADITITNLKIAFPEKSEKELDELVKKSFDSAYMAGVESLIAWFMSPRRFKKINFEIENRELFDRLHNDPNKTLLFLGFHFHTLEIVGRYIGTQYSPFTLVYQKHNNEAMEELITSSREKHVTKCFQRKSLFPIIKSLKKKVTMWYAPDQDFGHEHTVFVPFFGKQCSTLGVTSWLVEKSKATVVPVYYTRNEDLSGYKVILADPIEDFPSDPVEGAKLTNSILEEFIKKCPEQYLWQHRRFKTRPEGEAKIY